MACPLAAERVWTEKSQYQDAEQKYFEHISKLLKGSTSLPLPTTGKNNSNIARMETAALPQLQLGAEIVAAAAAVQPTKQKTKKDKNNKAKQLSKQNTNDSIKSEKNEQNNKVTVAKNVATGSNASPLELNDDIEKCPYKNAMESVTKAKKQRKREKKLLKESDSSVSTDDLPPPPAAKANNKNKAASTAAPSANVFVVDNRNASSVVVTKTKEPKEKKSKSDKKKSDKNEDNEDQAGGECTLVSEIAKARQHIKNSLERMDGIAALASTPGRDVLERISTLEKENGTLRELVEQLKKTSLKSEDRIKQLEQRLQTLSVGGGSAPAAAAAAAKVSDDDDGVDLFGSDSEGEDDAAAKIREQRLAEYAAKKSKKPTLIAKSNIILDIKPWDDETDMKAMEAEVRKIVADGLLWGTAKSVPIAFGIHKLTISTVVEDEKISVDWLIEEIEKIEELVQSVDVAAFNKI